MNGMALLLVAAFFGAMLWLEARVARRPLRRRLRRADATGSLGWRAAAGYAPWPDAR